MTERLPAALEFLREVAARVTSIYGDLEVHVADGRLELRSGETSRPLTLAFGPDSRGHVKLYAAAVVAPADSRSAGSRLGRVLGTVQVIPAGDHHEVRRWSPYRLEDVERSRAEAEEWGSATLVSLLRELPADSAGRAAPAIDQGAAPAPAGVLPPDSSPATTPGTRPAWIGDPESARLRVALEELEARLAAVIVERDRLQAETAALRAGGTGDEEVARLGAELEAVTREVAESVTRAEAATAEAATTRLSLDESRAALALAEAERDRALSTITELQAEAESARAGTTPALERPDLAPRLLDAFSLMSDAGAKPGTCASVLRTYLDIMPGDPQLGELLGVYLLRDDQVREAIRTLSAVGAGALTPRGAAALVEAAFRLKELPEPLDVVGRVDWLVGAVAQQLRDVPRWLRGPDLLRLSELVAENAPPDAGSFLAEVARVATRDQLVRVFDIWFDLEAEAAVDQLIAWAEAGRVQAAEQWVREAFELGLTADDRRIVRSALELLARDAERARDPVRLLTLVDTARDRLRPADGREFAVRWLREIAPAVAPGVDEAWVDRAVAVLLDSLRDVPSLPDDAPELELAQVLLPRASAEAATMLRDALDRRRPRAVGPVSITSVAEALEAAASAFPSLVVLDDAERSAAQRGTVGVKKAREALFRLGDIAQRYAKGELDQGLDEALATLPDFKPDISDTARQRYLKDYRRVLADGRKVVLGPHFDIGGEDGRAYIYVDRVAHRIVLGHCGNHLRGKQDS